MLLVEPETGKIVDVNRAAEYFYGRSDKELCAQSIDDINILPPEEVAALRAKVVRKEVTVFTARHRLASGEIKTVEVHSSPIVIGKKTVLFSIIHDLTDKETSGRDAAGIRDKDYDLR